RRFTALARTSKREREIRQGAFVPGCDRDESARCACAECADEIAFGARAQRDIDEEKRTSGERIEIRHKFGGDREGACSVGEAGRVELGREAFDEAIE